jgi:peptidoglycan/xylan/chitin deacetylase (PgdA/CDA1 family)
MRIRLFLGATWIVSMGCGSPGKSTSASANTRATTAAIKVDTPGVSVLVYHSIAPHHPGQTLEQRVMDVDPAAFRDQMQYLAEEKYNVVPFSDIVDAVASHKTLPPHTVALTFDDGWKTQYDFAVPILRQLHFPATFFVATDEIESGPAFMTWDDLKKLKQMGMTIAAHSRTHPDLTDKGVPLSAEIDGSKQDIERYLGFTPDLFAYPYGAYDAKVVSVVRAAGFRGARALAISPKLPPNVFAIRGVLATDAKPAFEHALTGLP